MAQVRIQLQWRGKVETFSWARVQAMGNGVQLPLGVGREVRPLEQVPAQQAIRVLVGATLPGTMRISEEDADRESLSQAFVLGQLFASIVRQGFAQRGGHVPELLRETLTGACRICPLHPGQDDQARGPLHQCADGRAIAGPLEKIAFPVALHRTGGHLSGPLGERRHLGDLAPSIGPSRPRSTRLARPPQGCQQFAPQGPTGQDIQARIDGLGRQLFRHVVRIRASEPSSNLLRRTPLS